MKTFYVNVIVNDIPQTIYFYGHSRDHVLIQFGQYIAENKRDVIQLVDITTPSEV